MRRILYTTIQILALTALSLSFHCCRSVRYIPVETVRTEYQNHTDTVRMSDSVVIERETIVRQADSALINRLGLSLKEGEKAILVLQKQLERNMNRHYEHTTDTVMKTDSIQVPYPVERRLSKWEQVKMDIGGIAMGACIILCLSVIVVFIARAYRKV